VELEEVKQRFLQLRDEQQKLLRIAAETRAAGPDNIHALSQAKRFEEKGHEYNSELWELAKQLRKVGIDPTSLQ
jgi:hypothetical protein